MASRRTMPLPIPGQTLQRMQAQLAPAYGSEVWEKDGQRVLVIRTPGLDPDVVNDLEAAIEYLEPRDVRDLQACLLVGESRSTAVSVGPLQDLMAQRLRQDRQVADLLRKQIPGRQGHILYRAPQDPKRLGRLGIRIPHAHARDIDDEDLDDLADELGPRLETPAFTNVRAVYILADQDDVRLDADLFFQDMRDRWQDESRRVAAEEEARRKALEEENARQREREEIMETLRSRYIGNEARASGPRHGVSRFGSSEPRIAHQTEEDPPAAGDRGRRIDAELERRLGGASSGRSSAGGGRSASTFATPPKRGLLDAPSRPVPLGGGVADGGETADAPVGSPARTTTAPATVVQEALEAAGFEVMASPRVPGHTIDLAAERDGEHPRRVIVRIVPRLDVGLADEVLDSCRALESDLALVVAQTADDEARERFVATKAKWVPPTDLADLRL